MAGLRIGLHVLLGLHLLCRIVQWFGVGSAQNQIGQTQPQRVNKPMSNQDTKPVELSLYKAHEKIYPREVKGRFQFKRKLAVWLLLGLFYLLPWITWGGEQAVLFDMPQRRFHIFGITLWPQDFIFLALMLIIDMDDFGHR